MKSSCQRKIGVSVEEFQCAVEYLLDVIRQRRVPDDRFRASRTLRRAMSSSSFCRQDPRIRDAYERVSFLMLDESEVPLDELQSALEYLLDAIKHFRKASCDRQ